MKIRYVKYIMQFAWFMVYMVLVYEYIVCDLVISLIRMIIYLQLFAM